jgi:hypothetical protein
MAQLYANWLTAHPEKANRLAEIVAETRATFRDAVSANPANVMDTATDTVPNVGFRHALNMAIYNLGMEMGAQMASDADSVVTRAEIWLRMVENGGIPIPCDEDLRGGTPSYRTPAARCARPARLASALLVAVTLAGTACAGWLSPGPSGGLAEEILFRMGGDRDNAQALASATQGLWKAIDGLSYSASYASGAGRVLQVDTNAWLTVANGTATLWRVNTTPVVDRTRLVVSGAGALAVNGTYAGSVESGYFENETDGNMTVIGEDDAWFVYFQGGGGWLYHCFGSETPVGGTWVADYGLNPVPTFAWSQYLVTNTYPIASWTDVTNIVDRAIDQITPASIGAATAAQGAKADTALQSRGLTNEYTWVWHAVPSAATSLAARAAVAQTITQIVARCDVGAATATVFSVAIWSNAWETATKVSDITVSAVPALVDVSAGVVANGGWAIAFTNGFAAVSNGFLQLRTVNR